MNIYQIGFCCAYITFVTIWVVNDYYAKNMMGLLIITAIAVMGSLFDRIRLFNAYNEGVIAE